MLAQLYAMLLCRAAEVARDHPDLYDGPMVGMSELGSVQVMASLCASHGASN